MLPILIRLSEPDFIWCHLCEARHNPSKHPARRFVVHVATPAQTDYMSATGALVALEQAATWPTVEDADKARLEHDPDSELTSVEQIPCQ